MSRAIATSAGDEVAVDGAASSSEPQGRPLPDSKRVRKALEVLAKEEERRAKWEAAAFAKQAELEGLKSRVGAEVVAAADEDAESLAQRLSRQVVELAAAVDTANGAAVACEPRVVAAKRAVLRAEADDLRDLVQETRKRSEAHDRRLEDLLRQLREHDGAKYVVWEPEFDVVRASGPAGMDYALSKSKVLAGDVARLQLQLEIVEAAARGEGLARFSTHMSPWLPDGGAGLYSPRVKGPHAYFPELLSQ